jgi:hypothetical protein
MALNIKSPRVDALARELAALRKQSITEVVEAALDALKERENEAKDALQQERKRALDASLAEIWSHLPFEDADPRPLKEIRDELWGEL